MKLVYKCNSKGPNIFFHNMSFRLNHQMKMLALFFVITRKGTVFCKLQLHSRSYIPVRIDPAIGLSKMDAWVDCFILRKDKTAQKRQDTEKGKAHRYSAVSVCLSLCPFFCAVLLFLNRIHTHCKWRPPKVDINNGRWSGILYLLWILKPSIINICSTSEVAGNISEGSLL